jgi:hypothetical protein
MDWKDVVAKISQAAPLVGSLFGPAGTAVGGVVKLAASALGVAPTEEAIAAEIERNPEAVLKLRELEMTHKVEMEKLAIAAETARLADVQDARKREVAIVQATGKRDWSQEILGWIIVTGFFAVLGIRMFVTIPVNQLENVGMLIGALITAFTTVVAYRYGSSKGSADRAAQISALMEKKG